MSPRHPWPPEPAPAQRPFVGKTLLGNERVTVILHPDATKQDRLATARQILAGTGHVLCPEGTEG